MINNEEHDLCRFVTIEKRFYYYTIPLHKETTSRHSIRTSIMLSAFQLISRTFLFVNL